MSLPDTQLTAILRQTDTLVLPGNRPYIENFEKAGGRVTRQDSGHLVWYGPGHRRILMTDPDGHPLHECEWIQTPDGRTHLQAARIQLDWGQWVGLKPEGLVNQSFLDLSTRPGWQTMTRDDLRMMAAQAMKVSLDDIRFFYTDGDVSISQSGQATIQQRKDAFYVLNNGRFDEAQFMSCMSAMQWDRIDYLPVVELFLSLLPGTGSATFELIRGLYDDQNPAAPLPLQYRGIPVYPSEGAFRLFSQFFAPSVLDARDPLAVFLDTAHSGEVTWLPCPNPPQRYFDTTNNLCITVKNGTIQKATLSDDASGLPFFAPNPRGHAPNGRAVGFKENSLVLQDGLKQVKLPINPSWGISPPSAPIQPVEPASSWHQLFPEGEPRLEPVQAFSSTLLYPMDERVIGEPESQPFVLDYWDDLIDEDLQLRDHIAAAKHVLISRCDAALGSTLRWERQTNYTILYGWPEFAQKQAQQAWNQLAQSQRLDWIDHIRFLPYAQHSKSCLEQHYDVLYSWLPFSLFYDRLSIDQTCSSLGHALLPGGIAFVSGSSLVADSLTRHGMELLYGEHVQTLPTFRLHRSILPRAHVHKDLMAFVCLKAR